MRYFQYSTKIRLKKPRLWRGWGSLNGPVKKTSSNETGFTPPLHAGAGFTLVEIMVVVSIVVILATLAISLILRNRITTNEAVAITSCRTINSACQSYYAGTLPHAYPDSLGRLGPALSTPSYIDSALASGSKGGYDFIYEAGEDEVSFTLLAEPVVYQRTGNRFFYTDETGRTTAKEGETAGPDDPAI